MKIDHIGYAVRNMGFAISVFELLGYTFQETKIDDARKVKVKIGTLDATRIELLSPIGGEKSPIDNYLEKLGCTPYHICYEVENMAAGIQELTDKEFTLVNAPAPSEPLGGVVAFLYSIEIGLIELIEYHN